MRWVSIRLSFWGAWLLVILMVAVASIALMLITLESKVSYVRYCAIERCKPKPKGKHRRTYVTQD